MLGDFPFRSLSPVREEREAPSYRAVVPFLGKTNKPVPTLTLDSGAQPRLPSTITWGLLKSTDSQALAQGES